MKDYDPNDPEQLKFDRAARGEPPPDGGGNGNGNGCACIVGLLVVAFLVMIGTCSL